MISHLELLRTEITCSCYFSQLVYVRSVARASFYPGMSSLDLTVATNKAKKKKPNTSTSTCDESAKIIVLLGFGQGCSASTLAPASPGGHNLDFIWCDIVYLQRHWHFSGNLLCQKHSCMWQTNPDHSCPDLIAQTNLNLHLVLFLGNTRNQPVAEFSFSSSQSCMAQSSFCLPDFVHFFSKRAQREVFWVKLESAKSCLRFWLPSPKSCFLAVFYFFRGTNHTLKRLWVVLWQLYIFSSRNLSWMWSETLSGIASSGELSLIQQSGRITIPHAANELSVVDVNLGLKYLFPWIPSLGAKLALGTKEHARTGVVFHSCKFHLMRIERLISDPGMS